MMKKIQSFAFLKLRINYPSLKLFKKNFCNTGIAKEKIKLKFKYLADNSIKEVEANLGDHLLETAHKNDIDIEGACDASLACSTCHIILEEKIYESIPKPKEEEDDLLDLAFGLTHTSRLGCQVFVTKEFSDTIISIPAATRNLYVDGHKPKPH